MSQNPALYSDSLRNIIEAKDREIDSLHSVISDYVFVGGLAEGTIEVFLGLISSTIFLFIVLYLLRPQIAISQAISKQTIRVDENDQQTFVFKMINKSWFDAFDIQLELFCIEQYRIPNGINERMTAIDLVCNEIKHLPPFRKSGVCKKRRFANHAVLFRTNADLETLIREEPKSLQLQVTLRHGLTGLSRVYKCDYINTHCIADGPFEFGNSLDVQKKN